ncbi:MAG TPA: FtsX-like permease family protein, partial [Actinomycetales bacterium]
AQAVLVTLLSAVVALCSVLGVAYAAAVEESVQRQVLQAAPESQRGVAVTATAERPPAPDELRAAVLPSLGDPAWGPPVAGASADGLVATTAGTVLVPVTTREGACARLRLDDGRCPAAPGEVLVSRRTAALLGTAVGRSLSVADASASGTAPVLPALRVVGVHAPHPVDDAFWFDRPSAAAVPAAGEGGPVGGDALIVDWPTLRSGAWRSVTTTVDVPLRPEAVPIERTAQVRAALAGVLRAAAGAGATTRTQLPAVLDSVPALRDRARAPLPLLALQVVLLSLVVLGYVAAATTEQRRPEVALARLRGQQPLPTALGMVRELGVLVAAGCLVGGLLGWGAARLAAGAWLAEGIGVPLRWPMLLAVAGSTAAGIVAVTLTAVPTVREPLVTLLRAVPPRSSALRAGVADGAVVALCAAGLVTLLTGDRDDPTALLAPGLLALAGGLALSQGVVPAAVLVGRAALRRGSLATALAAVAVARRPSLRRLVAIVTVAVALLVFAVSATAVGGDQRRVAAAREVGAAAVLSVAAAGPAALREAVQRSDPSGGYATPVLVMRSAAPQGPRTVAVDPVPFGRIALWGRSVEPGAGAPRALAVLSQLRPQPVALQGLRVQVTASYAAEPITLTAQELDAGATEETGPQRPVSLHLVVVEQQGRVHDVDLGALRSGRQELAATVPCSRGCLVRRIEARRTFGDAS